MKVHGQPNEAIKREAIEREARRKRSLAGKKIHVSNLFAQDYIFLKAEVNKSQ